VCFVTYCCFAFIVCFSRFRAPLPFYFQPRLLASIVNNTHASSNLQSFWDIFEIDIFFTQYWHIKLNIRCADFYAGSVSSNSNFSMRSCLLCWIFGVDAFVLYTYKRITKKISAETNIYIRSVRPLVLDLHPALIYLLKT
jgi:hypothetical protein